MTLYKYAIIIFLTFSNIAFASDLNEKIPSYEEWKNIFSNPRSDNSASYSNLRTPTVILSACLFNLGSDLNHDEITITATTFKMNDKNITGRIITVDTGDIDFGTGYFYVSESLIIHTKTYSGKPKIRGKGSMTVYVDGLEKFSK
jgi:hypothetical protein